MSRSILVVDDIPFVRKTLISILKSAQYQVVGEAEDGEQAVRLFERLKPDLITMDLVMPKMSGIDAIRHIMKSDKHARVVVVSAMGQEDMMMDAIQAGARDYIMKPFSIEDLLRTVERVLSGAAAQSKGASKAPSAAER